MKLIYLHNVQSFVSDRNPKWFSVPAFQFFFHTETASWRFHSQNVWHSSPPCIVNMESNPQLSNWDHYISTIASSTCSSYLKFKRGTSVHDHLQDKSSFSLPFIGFSSFCYSSSTSTSFLVWLISIFAWNHNTRFLVLEKLKIYILRGFFIILQASNDHCLKRAVNTQYLDASPENLLFHSIIFKACSPFYTLEVCLHHLS